MALLLLPDEPPAEIEISCETKRRKPQVNLSCRRARLEISYFLVNVAEIVN